jgi:hypothetical protein
MDDFPFEAVLTSDDCWFWLRSYGGTKRDRAYYKNKLVYRLLFEHCRGIIPEGLGLDHVVCDNPFCINPWHVEPRTQKQNLERVDLKRNLGVYTDKGNTFSAKNLGIYLTQKDRERNALGQFVGG